MSDPRHGLAAGDIQQKTGRADGPCFAFSDPLRARPRRGRGRAASPL